MNVDKWCKQKADESKGLAEVQKMKFFGFQQPQIILATLYTQAKMGNNELTVAEVSDMSNVPYSTCKSALNTFEKYGLVRRLDRRGKAHVYRTYVSEMERLIKKLADNK